jgi:hypothetical protein
MLWLGLGVGLCIYCNNVIYHVACQNHTHACEYHRDQCENACDIAGSQNSIWIFWWSYVNSRWIVFKSYATCWNSTRACRNHTREYHNHTRERHNHNHKCQNHSLRVEITLVRVDITGVNFVITFVSVKITLRVEIAFCVYKSHSASRNHACTCLNHSRSHIFAC